nr:WYL domain-containing protein [bacterium]
MAISVGKQRLLAVAQLMLEKTDEGHPLSAEKLCRLLEEQGIPAERKTVYDDLNQLRQRGMDVRCTGGRGGYYIATRPFGAAEIRLLASAVLAARFIPEGQAQGLVHKLLRLVPEDQADMLLAQLALPREEENGNPQLYAAIDVLQQAIDKGCKASFYYATPRAGEGRPKRPRSVSPYALVWAEDALYLIAHDPRHRAMTHFRVDRMSGVRKLRTRATPCDAISHYASPLDVKAYMRGRFSMFAGAPVDITLWASEAFLPAVMERLPDARAVPDQDGGYIVRTAAQPGAGFIAWLAHFGGEVRVISPQETVDDIRRAYGKLMEAHGQ